jgi:hypothetical protein
MSAFSRKVACIGGVCFVLLSLLAGCSHEPKPSAVVSAKGAFEELRTAVRDEIKDPAKSAEVVGLVDQLEQIMIEAAETRKAHTARLHLLNANYDETEEDFKVAFAEFNAKQNSRQERILAIDQRARVLTTASEWKAIFKEVAHTLEAAARAELEMQQPAK